ncbi:MAG: HAD-IB family phosphatase [Clostridia bacterium]|nr:HAD-IB family phosphatase [Clostridia bacterium]
MPAIMFDFDGTITAKCQNVWAEVWKSLGFDTSKESRYFELFKNFLDGKINHTEWCTLTGEEWAKKGLTRDKFYEIVKSIDIQPIMGAKEAFKMLKSRGYEIHIISGNFDTVIDEFLTRNGLREYIDSINANKIVFDKDGNYRAIIDTDYDFEGKARFINEFKEKTGMSPYNICFVGNGDNDEWAHLSGCKTICINPKGTDHTDRTKWHHGIEKVYNLQQIIPYVMLMEPKLPAVKASPANIMVRPSYEIVEKPVYALAPIKEKPLTLKEKMEVAIKKKQEVATRKKQEIVTKKKNEVALKPKHEIIKINTDRTK